MSPIPQFLAHTSSLPPDVWDKLGVNLKCKKWFENHNFYRKLPLKKFVLWNVFKWGFPFYSEKNVKIQRTREAGRAWRTLIAFWTDKVGQIMNYQMANPLLQNRFVAVLKARPKPSPDALQPRFNRRHVALSMPVEMLEPISNAKSWAGDCNN